MNVKKKAVTVENEKKLRLGSTAIELKNKISFYSSPAGLSLLLTTVKFKNENKQI